MFFDPLIALSIGDDEIIKMGVDALIVIEDDMRKIDKWCNENNKQDDLFNAVGFIALLSSFFE